MPTKVQFRSCLLFDRPILFHTKGVKTSVHPCQKCGACCTTFCVSFSAREFSEERFGVPEDLTFKVSEDTFAMKNKKPQSNRCVALEGHVGNSVGCKIYENRPSPCRNFKASYEDGVHNPRCDKCRLSRGLQPLTPRDWNHLSHSEPPSSSNL